MFPFFLVFFLDSEGEGAKKQESEEVEFNGDGEVDGGAGDGDEEGGFGEFGERRWRRES